MKGRSEGEMKQRCIGWLATDIILRSAGGAALSAAYGVS